MLRRFINKCWDNIKKIICKNNDKLKCYKGVYINITKLDNDYECPICLDNITNGDKKEKIIQLICYHIYHEKCINRWVLHQENNNQKVTCALCREDIEI